MTKILFINPFSWSRNEYPPLGIGYLVSVAKQSGYTNIDVIDAGAVDYNLVDILDTVKKFDPDVCGLSLYATNVFLAYELISAIKKVLPNCMIIVGGPHATTMPERTLFECKDIDFLVYGEGEETFIELLEAISENRKLDDVKGIVFRKNEKIIKNPPREFIRDLDTIPFPDRDVFSKYNYPYDAIILSKPAAQVITSRGCPYNCAFCAAKAVWGSTFRRRSPENVIEEIALLQHKYKTKEIYFVDDLFAIDRKWLDKFYSLLRQEKLDIDWKCLARPDLVAKNDLKKLKQHGCHTIEFGVESGNNKILRSINKRFTTQQVIKAFKAAKEIGLNTHGFFIFGHAEDTYQTALQTLKFAMKLNPSVVSFFILVPFPGTKNYTLLSDTEKYDWGRMAYYHKDTLPFSICEISPADLLKLEKEAWTKFYGRLNYMLWNVFGNYLRNNRVALKYNLNCFKRHFAERLPKYFRPIVKYGSRAIQYYLSHFS